MMSTAENTYHTYLHILQDTSCIRKSQVTRGEGGAYPLHPPPRSAPVVQCPHLLEAEDLRMLYLDL